MRCQRFDWILYFCGDCINHNLMLKDNFDKLILEHGYINEPVSHHIDLIKEITRLKQDKNAVILGHN